MPPELTSYIIIVQHQKQEFDTGEMCVYSSILIFHGIEGILKNYNSLASGCWWHYWIPGYGTEMSTESLDEVRKGERNNKLNYFVSRVNFPFYTKL